MKEKSINDLLQGKTPINVSIDREARAIYFKVSDHPVFRTERFNSSVSIDYDKNNEVIGIEIIRIRNILSIFNKTFQDISSEIPPTALAA